MEKIYERSINTFFPLHAIIRGVYRHSRLQTAAVAAIIGFHELIGTWRKRIDRYIILTDFGKNLFTRSKFGHLKNKLVVKPNFVTDTGAGPIERKPCFLFIGRLCEEKGTRTLLEAAVIGGFQLVIGGDGPMRPDVEKYACAHPNIRYRGLMTRNEVIAAMKTSKALIFPSQWYEGFPVTILEAFCSATPVIASAIGSMLEIVKDGWNGKLFKPGDVKDLVWVVEEFSSERQQALNMQWNAREDYLGKYQPRNSYHQLIRIYKDAIAAHQQKELQAVPSMEPSVITKT